MDAGDKHPPEGESQSGDVHSARTDLAEDRTILASERTFASWLRTGFAGIGIGLAFNALFVRLEPTWVPRLIATAFLAIAIFIFIAAERRACAVLTKLSPHQVQTARQGNLQIITYVSAAATLALIAAIWLLDVDAKTNSG